MRLRSREEEFSIRIENGGFIDFCAINRRVGDVEVWPCAGWVGGIDRSTRDVDWESVNIGLGDGAAILDRPGVSIKGHHGISGAFAIRQNVAELAITEINRSVIKLHSDEISIRICYLNRDLIIGIHDGAWIDIEGDELAIRHSANAVELDVNDAIGLRGNLLNRNVSAGLLRGNFIAISIFP